MATQIHGELIPEEWADPLSIQDHFELTAEQLRVLAWVDILPEHLPYVYYHRRFSLAYTSQLCGKLCYNTHQGTAITCYVNVLASGVGRLVVFNFGPINGYAPHYIGDPYINYTITPVVEHTTLYFEHDTDLNEVLTWLLHFQ